MSGSPTVGLEIKRPASTNSLSSECTSYSFDSDGDGLLEEAAQRAEGKSSLTQPEPGPSGSTQPGESASSSSRAVPSAKRKLDVLLDDASAALSSTRSSSLKLPRLADSKFSPDSTLHLSPGDEVQPYIIADDTGSHSPFRSAPVGFQWELAGWLSGGTEIPDNVQEQLKNCITDKLSNTEAAAAISRLIEGKKQQREHPLTSNLAKAFEQENAAKIPWQELDREEAHEQQHTTVGPSGLYFADPARNWYGGKVHFPAQLSLEKSEYSLILRPPYLGSSCRFTRRFGSKRFIPVKISRDKKSYDDEKARKFFYRPFILFGRVFRAFFAKEQTVFLVQTDEGCCWDAARRNWDITPHRPLGEERSPYDLSFFEFLQWHNPLELNSGQLMAKWVARFSLGLSNSIPGVKIKKEDYFIIDDIVAEPYMGQEKVPAEYTMTDGCGFANGDFFLALAESLDLGWHNFPVAVQIRINGAKGLLTLNPNEISPTPEKRPRVWIRKSQCKIKYEDGDDDVGHYTVDILRYSRMSTPAYLSTETIINLAENGVPPEAFITMTKEAFNNRVSGLTTWDGPNGLYKLWRNICHTGQVIPARLARQNPGSARAKGYVVEDVEKAYDGSYSGGDELDDMVGGNSTAWWEDAISGQPSSLEETCAGLLDAGFSPDSSPILRMKLTEVAKKSMESLRSKYRIQVPLSCTAFVIPDPVGVLSAGECHIKFSSRRVSDVNGVPTDTVIGPVLLTRHPCKLPSDVQQATAVNSNELRHYVDVIIVSTKGHVVNGKTIHRHLASLTGGGDYDGDLMSAFWQPELVKHFKSADPSFANVPSTVLQSLEKSSETVSKFLSSQKSQIQPLNQQILQVQGFLLAPLKDVGVVGMYSTYWENSIYCNGYSHDETIRLAHIFCQVLDGTKTGVTMEPKQRQNDAGKYGSKAPPLWKPVSKTKAPRYSNMANLPPITRDPNTGLGIFIMDILNKEVKEEAQRQLKNIETRLGDSDVEGRPRHFPPDEHLQQPWQTFKAKVDANDPVLGPYMATMKASIEKHVQDVYQDWRSLCLGAQFTGLPITERQNILRSLSRKFASFPNMEITRMHDSESVARLKASCAYNLVRRSRYHCRFPWDVAYRDLCAIKAKAMSNNTEKTITSNFYARMDLHRLALEDS